MPNIAMDTFQWTHGFHTALDVRVKLIETINEVHLYVETYSTTKTWKNNVFIATKFEKIQQPKSQEVLRLGQLLEVIPF